MRIALVLSAILVGLALLSSASPAERLGEEAGLARALPSSLVSDAVLDELSQRIAELEPFPPSDAELSASAEQLAEAPPMRVEGALAQR